MTRFPRSAIPFIGLGTAFIGLGLAGPRVFLYVGLAFFVLGVVIILARRGRA